jgi:hypothetical protein
MSTSAGGTPWNVIVPTMSAACASGIAANIAIKIKHG